MLSIPDWHQLQHRAAGRAKELASIVCHSTVRQAQGLRIEAVGTLCIIDWQDRCGFA